MKKPFAVGERVRVIIAAGDVQDGTINSECPGGWTVELDDPADIVTVDADPRQLRRLVKRKPAREWVLEIDCTGEAVDVASTVKDLDPYTDNTVVVVREVRPKK